ncbi:MAG: hypothetical protein AAF193_04310 [Bacteroidota bacterium]
MRKLLLLLLCTGIGLNIYAQEKEHQLFFDGSRFIRSMVAPDQLSYQQTGLLIGYKRYNEIRAFRSSLILNFNGATDLEDAPSKSLNYHISPSVGIEWKKPFFKKWSFLFGTDLYSEITIFNQKRENDQGETLSESTSEYYGIGLRPFAGIHFQINERISLFTETRVTLFAFRERGNLTTDQEGLSGSINAPLSLFLVFHFPTKANQ